MKIIEVLAIVLIVAYTASSSDLKSDIPVREYEVPDQFNCSSSSEDDFAQLTLKEWTVVAELLRELLRKMRINEVFICSSDSKHPAIMALRQGLIRGFIFAGKCDAKELMTTSITHRESYESLSLSTIPRFNQKMGIIYLLLPGEENAMMGKLIWHDVITTSFYQNIILKSYKLHCFMPTNFTVTTSWLQATYFKNERSLQVEEIYTFQSSTIPVFTTLGHISFTNDSTIEANLYPLPKNGPMDFRNNFISVVSRLGPPYVIAFPEECRGPIERESLKLHETPSCRLIHHNADRIYVMNKSSIPHEIVPVPAISPIYGGYLMDIFLTVAEKLNFRFVLVSPPAYDTVFGEDKFDNGSFNGLVGALQKKEAEVAIASFTMTRGRLRVMDFSTIIDKSVHSLFIDGDAVLSTLGWNTYVLSFHWTSWVAIVLSLVLSSSVLLLMVHSSNQEDMYFQQMQNVVFMLYGCLVQQGSGRLPLTSRVQAIFMIFWISSVILYAFYTARLTSYLTTSSQSLPFDSLASAVMDDEWKVGMAVGTSTTKMLKDSDDKVFKTFYKQLQSDNSSYVFTDEQGLDKVLKEQYAFFCENPSVLYLLKGNCSITEVPGDYFPAFLHLGYIKHLPFAKVIDEEIFKLLMGGVLQRIHQKWWGKNTSCKSKSVSSFTELDFSNIITAYIILGLGILVAAIVFSLEVLYVRRTSNGSTNVRRNVSVNSTARTKSAVVTRVEPLEQWFSDFHFPRT